MSRRDTVAKVTLLYGIGTGALNSERFKSLSFCLQVAEKSRDRPGTAANKSRRAEYMIKVAKSIMKECGFVKRG